LGRLSRPLVTLSAAVALPLVVLLGLQVLSFIDQRRQTLEREGLARSEQVMLLIDERLKAELQLAQFLATSVTIKSADWSAAYNRSVELQSLRPSWRGVILTDLSTGEIYDTRQPFSAGRRPPLPAALSAAQAGLSTPLIDEIVLDRDNRHSIYIHTGVRRGDALVGVLSVALDPNQFQAILTNLVSTNQVAAVVDRSGDFIGRNLDYENRIGRPATAHVQEAVRSTSPSGIYQGKTWEGLQNYSSFTKSAFSGWSAHIAVDSSSIDAPRRLSLAILIGVGAICVILALAVVVATLRELAERNAAEDRLRQAQKMEAVGQLTGGIAHDFNNLLTAIIGGLDLALRKMKPDDPSRRYLDGAAQAAQRGAKLTSQLLAFSRVQRLEVTLVDLKALLDGMRELLDQSLGPAVRLEIDVAADAAFVRSDANQLELALLNLAVNARDAMPEGGQLAITVRRQADLVEIAVRDTGQGMTKQVAERALEPFYTTKEPGKGTGLGLSQVYGLIRQSHGSVKIDSGPGEGTTVRLLLPRADPPVDVAQTPMTKQSDRASPRRRIFVLDDEGDVRVFLADTLRLAGHKVMDKADPFEALGALAAFDPDLLVVDFAMPGMNGAEAARRARTIKPGLKVLVVSGYADSAALTSAIGDAPILRKPFDGATLMRAVSDVLAAGAP